MSDAYDVLIIGAGPGGYVAAIRAAQLGLKTAVVDREHLGGICLNWGCIPTKALLRSAEIYHYMQHAADYGLSAEKVGFDAAAIVKRSRGVSGRLNGGVGMLLKKNKVDVIWGEAAIESAPKGNAPGKVAVRETKRAEAPKGAKGAGTYEARHIIVATGARPRAIPGIEPDKKQIWTYYEAMVPEAMPKSLLVMGSGAIGIEFASFYRTMGAEVTVVELLPQILPVEDAEIAGLARKRFEKQGIKILTGAKVTKVEKGADSVTATVETGDGKSQKITAEKLISAVGVVGNIEGIGLEKLGVTIERGIVATDGLGRTNVPGVYAIGDVAGPPMLAHKAEHEGVICVETIKGLHAHPMDKGKIPGCTYCQPQIASVGLTEAKAKEQGFSVKVGRFPFAGNGKAIALGEPDGLIKTIFDAKTGQLLGAHMVGAEVTELIQGYVVAMTLETTEEELMHTVFPHPTLSEMMHESVLDAYGRVIHT
ncbi:MULTISPECIES: dihydrolipoyl dehydrogenase [Methylobacterium]|uniref:Dihydrolipoyl dehydrogenase n=5 Tax=Pseudomonadota TaxID=1224 RepID=A0ABQ4SVN8_9HYPH|nr:MULTISPECIES: dihydrolipoyl dehydrogenase [Methylobacterium]PIU08557.1 MAG: dihydrolipoyl dehydrogenase [Methylobacterium sp. CG09_land_8_20_14_0_10_71_15]PIU11360.1 MAG: dihydrolipoyl dehydrogenase [Methylobacterium sp. CG08_land_8_20_14_0_20_71_15]GBU19133.1 dihydrolipoamide dehydrogenase [Methylobacterium sp.]GJE05766.1 Dihydrolipoyl dehydrogenase [Methylobacterium jeotgali]